MLTIASGVSVAATGNVTLATGGAGPAGPAPPAAQAAPLINLDGAVSSGTGTISVLSGTNGTINIGSAGSIAAATVTLNSGSGGIVIAGIVGQPGGTIDITSGGPVTEASEAILSTGVLTSSGGIHGTANLLGTSNAINVIGGISVTGGDLNVIDGSNLILAGSQNANNLFYQVMQGGGTLTLGQPAGFAAAIPAKLSTPAGGRISLVADNVTVGAGASSVTATGGSIEIAPDSSIATTVFGNSGLVVGASLLSVLHTGGGTLEIGGFTDVPDGAVTPVASASSVDISAPFDASSLAGTLRLDATGAITQSGGALTVTNLAGSGGAWTLTNAGNVITGLGTVTATTFALTDNSALTINGTVAASTSATFNTTGALTIAGLLASPSVQLSDDSIAIPGSLDADSANLTASGTISETGSLTVVTLTGSAGAAVSLGGSVAGTNVIVTLGDFTAPSFTLDDGISLQLAGTLSANHIALNTSFSQLVLNDGATIITGGNIRPSGPLQPALEPANGAAGAYLRAGSIVQNGVVTVQGVAGGPATLQIATQFATQFDPPAGLQAPATWLILNLGAGSATGNVFVNALDVSYTIPGSANLTGTIAGITGGPAAATGFIQPAVNTNYVFNGCVIASASCLPTAPTHTDATNNATNNAHHSDHADHSGQSGQPNADTGFGGNLGAWRIVHGYCPTRRCQLRACTILLLSPCRYRRRLCRN